MNFVTTSPFKFLFLFQVILSLYFSQLRSLKLGWKALIPFRVRLNFHPLTLTRRPGFSNPFAVFSNDCIFNQILNYVCVRVFLRTLFIIHNHRPDNLSAMIMIVRCVSH